MPKAVPFWNFHVSTMALNISDICAYYPALLIIGVRSTMKNLIDQISIGCGVNSAIVNDAMKKPQFIQSCIDIPLKHNIKPPIPNTPWPFQNTSWEAYKLYCMIVVPKELYNLNKDDEFYEKLKNKKIFRNFEIAKEKKLFDDSPDYHFNSLRNSISHLNYSINEKFEYEMWDHPPGKKEKEYWHWNVKINGGDMQLFLGEVSEMVFDIYNEVKSGLRNSQTYQKV